MIRNVGFLYQLSRLWYICFENLTVLSFLFQWNAELFYSHVYLEYSRLRWNPSEHYWLWIIHWYLFVFTSLKTMSWFLRLKSNIFYVASSTKNYSYVTQQQIFVMVFQTFVNLGSHSSWKNTEIVLWINYYFFGLFMNFYLINFQKNVHDLWNVVGQ